MLNIFAAVFCFACGVYNFYSSATPLAMNYGTRNERIALRVLGGLCLVLSSISMYIYFLFH